MVRSIIRLPLLLAILQEVGNESEVTRRHIPYTGVTSDVNHVSIFLAYSCRLIFSRIQLICLCASFLQLQKKMQDVQLELLQLKEHMESHADDMFGDEQRVLENRIEELKEEFR